EQRARGKAASALATLRAGFTTIASMGSDGDRELIDSINAGSIPGPRILTSLSPLRDSTTPGRRLFRRKKADGADFIKIFAADSGTGGHLADLCRMAGKFHLRSVVHAQTDASIQRAVEAGCDQVEHGFQATPKGLRLLAERGIWFDPQCGLVFDNYLTKWPRGEENGGFDSTTMAMMEGLRRTLPPLLRTALAIPG